MRILNCLSGEAKSATEIAHETKLSLPYTTHQLQLLLAKEIISPEEKKTNTTHYGKPKKYYTVTKTFSEITTISPYHTARLSLSPVADRLITQLLLISRFTSPLHQEALSQYYWTHINEIDTLRAIFFLNETEHSLEILAIAKTHLLKKLRNTISKKTFTIHNKHITVSCWIHSEEEFLQGIQHNDNYYLDRMKQIQPLIDKHKIFKQLRLVKRQEHE